LSVLHLSFWPHLGLLQAGGIVATDGVQETEPVVPSAAAATSRHPSSYRGCSPTDEES
jgi:hypothetical protein